MSPGRASLGANWRDGAATFEVWAPEAAHLEVVLEPDAGPHRAHPMRRLDEGYFTIELSGVSPGALYRFRLDGRGPFPDPASRFQPQGVHGPSQVVDPGAFGWTDTAWRGGVLEETVLYELHIGTFTPAGTFRATLERLPYLRDLGVTAVELMPVADFAGDRNWGYDGVALFAPARCYGSPDDLRALVDAAHQLGLSVHLDVVYNHFGPDGAYQSTFSPHYISRSHRTPWGETLNFDGPGSRPVRDYVVENAVRWVREYHFDGLRLDATHAIVDDSPRPIVAEITAAVRDAVAASGRQVLVVAEDARNLRRVVESEAAGGWGAHATWSDDFHHQMRRALAGDTDGYFADFTGSTADIAATARQGWFYRGQDAPSFGGPRGTDPTGISSERFVFFLQNHDQTGNRALGDRLHHTIDLAAWRAASVLLLLLPETPLLFMGQEWGASTPFQFFTDHHPELGRAVTAGRRREFSRFAAFADPAGRETIPDPQDPETFRASRLVWEEQEREPHRSLLRLYRRLLAFRRTEAALRPRGGSGEPVVLAWGDEVAGLAPRGAGRTPCPGRRAPARGGGPGPPAAPRRPARAGSLLDRAVDHRGPVVHRRAGTAGSHPGCSPGSLRAARRGALRGHQPAELKMGASGPRRIPVSSYRLQLNPGFTLFDAAELVPYLAALGVTECYTSPVLAARPGSPHGYDVCDHGHLNPELGGEAGFAGFAVAARTHGLGILLDFVPNHMSTHPLANRVWRSVLENGPSSPYAAYFDIDWDPVKPELKGKILLPVLGDQYGVTLDSGQLRLELADGAFRLRYYGLDLPLNPRQLRLLLEHGLDAQKLELSPDDPDLTEFLSVLFHLEHLPPYTETDPRLVAERRREKEVALSRLAALLERAPRMRRHVDDNLRLFNGTPGEPASFDLLHALLEAQPYRLASWRTAMHEINYRRFFDVNELAGIRMEDPAVFAAAHDLVARLVADGSVTGLRLDHVDGLFDPAQYLHELAARFGPGPPVWTVVEKILSAGERLNDGWLVHGTTGYDFLDTVNGLFVDPAQGATFEALYASFVGERQAFPDVAYASKKVIIMSSMASELNVLAHELNRISESDRRFRDFTLDSLQEALREVVACFPVYRSYFCGTEPTPFDQATVDRAITAALRRNPALEPTIFHFIRQMLLPDASPGVSEAEQARRRRFAMKFQQYTGPVQAKGVEDTAFYRYSPLVSLNEVGGDPTRFGQPVAAFHTENQERLRRWPLSMLATATHDTKRGEDARARLNVLSELPRRWRALLSRWSRVAASGRATVQDRQAPSPAEEYLFYQALVGAWPSGLSGPPGPAFVERLRAYMVKAMREAKVHTSWINPSAEYERAVLEFVREVLAGSVSDRFRRSFAPFAATVAWVGMLNSLAQLVLKLGSPGVPDFYQGTELWDLSLVDPDNRQAVDYGHRRRLLAELASVAEAAGGSGDGRNTLDAVRALLWSWTDGRIKMYVTHVGLVLRRRHAPLFLEGEYLPLPAAGERSDHVVAFARRYGGQAALVLAPRMVVGLIGEAERLPVGTAVWGDTALPMPAGAAPGDYRNVLTGEILRLQGPTVQVAAALTTLPVGLWIGPAGA